MSAVLSSLERKSPAASFKFVPEMDGGLSSPAWCDRGRTNPLIQLCSREGLCLITMKKDRRVKGKWVPCRIKASNGHKKCMQVNIIYTLLLYSRLQGSCCLPKTLQGNQEENRVSISLELVSR